MTRGRPEQCDAADDRHRRLSSPLVVRASRLALWGLVAMGAVGGTVAALRPSTTVAAAAAEAVRPIPVGVGGVAEIAVRRWLTGDPEEPNRPVRPARATVLSATTVAVRDVGNDQWAATVAVELLDADHAGAPLLWHVEVGVASLDRGVVAFGTPALVPPPTPPEASGGGPMLRRPAADDPLAATAEAFLDALLTGSGDPTRYLAPGTHLAAVVQTGLRDVRVERTAITSAAADTTVLAAEAVAASAGGVEVRMVYELTLIEREGRWEVRAVGAPLRRASEPRGRERATTTTSPPTPPPASHPASSPGA